MILTRLKSTQPQPEPNKRPKNLFWTSNPRTDITLALFIPLLLTLFAPQAQADPASNPQAELNQRLTTTQELPDLLKSAIQANPAIESARQGWKAAVERYRIANAFADPKFSLTYPFETKIGATEWGISFSQGIPYPGRLTAEGEVVSAEIRLAQLTYDKTLREVVVGVRQSAYELLYLQAARKIAAGNQELLAQLSASGLASYAQERTTLIDLARASAQSGQLQYDTLLLQELEETEITRLNALLGRPPGTPIGPLVTPALRPLTTSLDELYRLAAENRSEVLLAKTNQIKAERGVTLAHYQTLPEFELGLFVNNVQAGDPMIDPNQTGIKSIGATLSLSLPIWFSKNRGRQGEAEAELGRSKSEVGSQINEARAEVGRLFFRLRNAERLIRLYREDLLPQAAKAVETAESWFKEGKGSLSDFTETRTVLYNFQLALARATADQGQNLAALEGLAGQSLTETKSEPELPKHPPAEATP